MAAGAKERSLTTAVSAEGRATVGVQQHSSLTPDVTSAAEARWVTRTVLAAWGLSHLDDVACLLVTELVANAVVHAGTTSELTLAMRRGRLHVSLADDDPRPPELRHGPPLSTSGRGIALVDALADDWGWEPTGDGAGKTVWFDLDTGASRAQAWHLATPPATSPTA